MKSKYFLFLIIIFPFSSFGEIPGDYYTTLTGKTGKELKTGLHKIIAKDTLNYLSYGAGKNKTWFGFYSTDRDEATNLVIDMYSSTLRYFPEDYEEQNYPGFQNELHIEHSFPKSWWNSFEGAAYKDLHHLYPADGSMNTSKSNNPLGCVNGTITKDNGISKTGKSDIAGYNGNVFEPNDEYKGDFARSYFYVITAYENYAEHWDSPMLDNNTYPVLKDWAIDLLMEWHEKDPVGEKELVRTEKVYNIQGNRNPYIDLPQLVDYIWGNKKHIAWNDDTSIVYGNANIYNIDFNNSILKIESNQTIPFELFIYSVLGNKLTHLTATTNTPVTVNLDRGIYIFYITIDGKAITKKILVNK